jgi:chaperone modulatory protein CbpM
MPVEQPESLWLHRYQACSLTEISELSGLSETELLEWVDVGVIAPADPDAEPWTFSADCLITIRTACRMRQDFELDINSAALVVSLIERVHALEAEIRDLRAKLPMVHR